MDTQDRRIGRPTKLNERIVMRLIQAVRKGASQIGACRYAGISPDSLQRWIAAGRDELAMIEAQPEGDYECSDAAALVMALDQALGEFEVQHVGNIETASEDGKNWTASAWLLERRLPKEWGKREQVDHTHLLIERTKQVAKSRGLNEDATATLIDFVLAREKKRAG